MPRLAWLTLSDVPMRLIELGDNGRACFFVDEDYRKIVVYPI